MILIRNGNIHTMAGEMIEGGSILIENGKIKEVGKDIVATLDAEIIDAGGKIVLPGLIDAHCHVGLFESSIGFEGDDGNEMTDPVTPQLRAIDGINPMDETLKEAYEAGVTSAATGPGSANVVGGQFALIKTYGSRIDNMIIDESIAMKIAFGENPKRVYHSMKKSPSTRMATASILRETLFKAKAYVEKQDRAEGDQTKMPEFDMKMEAMARVIRKEIPLKAHAHRADDIFTALRIAKEFDVDITLEHCTEGHLIADELAKDGKSVIIGPTFGHKSKFELKNKSFETPKVLHEAGVKFAIMTDAPVIPLDRLALCAAWAVNAGLDEEEALRAITINAAEILGVEDRIGSIEKGKDADIVIFDGHPLRDISAKAAVTIIDGKIVHRG
ncbi:amidohydrolase [Clostridium sp. D2Q-11]|uniref:Amidohydrolase n=1 Tax=Anaeromonas frigoriresistens TaxID=2683708 RepID=A0A942Z8N9_9FIRM|nr:amidohydrolase [Anaeromonas frigoriresistens]MBS4538100.1 amidohydrolase [Anaeromonas frigoriresistens]